MSTAIYIVLLTVKGFDLRCQAWESICQLSVFKFQSFLYKSLCYWETHW